ncbi:TBC1 domain family member 7 [Oratosquilla oratoria]|uniref:TBC1 domain family member 7 n=1 Tax=Oratosquilla oratoria TaxID=337810 RepID=UPI003F76C661
MNDERNFRSQYYEKVGFRCVEEKRSIETLLKDQPVDEKKLTNFSLRMTLPAAYRTLVWKLLLGITPRHPGAREYAHQQQVLMYEDLWSTLQALRLAQEFISITPGALALPVSEPYDQGKAPKPRHYLMMWLISNAKLLFNPLAQLRTHNNKCFLLIAERFVTMYKDPLDVYLMCSALWEDIEKNKAAIEGAIQDASGMIKKDNETLHQHLMKVGFFSSNIPQSFCQSLFCGIFPESAAEKVLDKVVAGCYKVLGYVLTALLTYLQCSLMMCGSANEMCIELNKLSEKGADVVVSSSMEQWHKVAITGTQKGVSSATN